MPTVRQLEEILAQQPSEDATPSKRPWEITSVEALRWGSRRTSRRSKLRNTLLALLDEARRTRWIALANLVISFATLLVVLLRG
jgi:hypothetical protein